MKHFGRDSAFLADLLQTIAERSRQLLGRRGLLVADLPLAELARQLISTRGEASGVALAQRMLEKWEQMDAAERLQWFKLVAADFGPDTSRLRTAVEAWAATPGPQQAQDLHSAAEPLRQELLRRINLAPGGTATLVGMREELLPHLAAHPDLAAVDADFAHLFTSWFNRGFLVLERIDWRTPAVVLEKLIHYEAVHAIDGWEDLRRRLAQDRRCFAFFHPALPDEPLIFVEVALVRGIAERIGPRLDRAAEVIDPGGADTAVFYSINHCQAGLRGISFGNFLIKQVAAELQAELPNLKAFATLSPVPGFRAWLETTPALRDDASELLGKLDGRAPADLPDHQELARRLLPLCAFYLARARRDDQLLDPVARFHLRNGARLERINWAADLSPQGVAGSCGIMVNYVYRLDQVERNHEDFVNKGRVVSSRRVDSLVRAAPAELSAILEDA